MFKPLQGVSGTLVQPAGAGDNIMYVDAQLAAWISAGLTPGAGNHTYLLIEQTGMSEAVKVMDFTPFALLVERGKDGSSPKTFLEGATLKYILTAEAVGELVVEAINALPPEAVLQFSINAPHSVERVDEQVTINIQPPNITSPDGTIDVTGSGLDIGISIQRGAFGCCD